MLPQLSIITPMYDRAGYITRCYQNLMQQTFSDWEWIVVNDGSKDDSNEIIENIQDDRIHFESYKENQGRGYARTQALNACKGKWIVIWDVDDIHFPDRLEQISQAQQRGYDFFCSYALVVDNNFEAKRIQGFYPNSRRFPGSFVHTTMACRLDLAKKIGYRPDLRAGEDLSMLWTLSSKYNGLFYKDVLSIIQQTDTSLKRAIECNLGHHAQIRELYNNAVITRLRSYLQIEITYILKLILLYSFRIWPPLYKKLSVLSSNGELESGWNLSSNRIDFIKNLKDNSRT